METLQQQLVIRFRLRISGDLDRGHLLDHGPAGEPGGQCSQPLLQRDIQTVGKKGHEDVRLDAWILLMVDRPDREITLQVSKGCLDLRQLDVTLPQDCRILTREVGT